MARVSIGIDELNRQLVRALRSKYSAEDATAIAEVMMFAELCGRTSHGVMRILPRTFGPLDDTPSGAPAIVPSRAACAHIDANGNPGMLVARRAADLAASLAAEHGAAVVTARGTASTSGALAYYAHRLSERDLASVIAANNTPMIAPPGGTQRIVGTNPFAVGMPTRSRPFLYDVSSSAISFGEVLAAGAAGRVLPEGTALDHGGLPTTNPALALKGALLAFGGHKGFGLALAIEILAGVLTNSTFGGHNQDHGWGHVIVALSLSAFGDPETLKANATQLLDTVVSAPTQSRRSVRIPGGRSLRNREHALRQGTVAIEDNVLEYLARYSDG